MKITIGVSNRHVHLTKEDYYILFGTYDLEKSKDLVQLGEFASTSKVSIKTENSYIDNVRVVGPFRNYTQAEISKTDSYKLGINPPIRTSGEIKNSCIITIIGPAASIQRECCIIPNRHIHINHNDRIKYGFVGVDMVSVKVSGEKSAVLENVYIKESDNGVFEMHIDTDDANACLLKTGDIGEIIF